MPTPKSRIRYLNEAAANPKGRYVIYWCVAQRRTCYNFGLEFALAEAKRLGLPLVFFEPLRLGYRWSAERHHRFVIEGMRDNAAALKSNKGVTYFPYVEPEAGAGKGLLAALAKDAALVVSDYAPYFFIPKMQLAAAQQIQASLAVVDSNGIVPVQALSSKWSNVAHSFRRRSRDIIPEELENPPLAEPLVGFTAKPAKLDGSIEQRWPKADLDALLAEGGLSSFAFKESVPPAPFTGGAETAGQVLDRFIDERLEAYLSGRLNLDDETCSNLSPWLHFGHISAHEVLARVIEREAWSPKMLAEKPTNQRGGWWNMSEEAEGFLDELITWRELGFHTCLHKADYDQLSSLPDWAKVTLKEHLSDKRETIYTLDQLAAAQTHDEVWNAAQRQLLAEGRIHNAVRMVWGKLVLAWTRTPEEALEYLIELNNRYALDGRDPNSYSGILWCFGRHDRAWGPVRPIYGKVRYMTSESFKRKATAKEYLRRWSGKSELFEA